MPISTDILWRVFHILTELVPYTVRQNNETRAHIAMWACPAFHYSVDLRIQTYTDPVPLKYGKIAPTISSGIRIFLQCSGGARAGVALTSTMLRLETSDAPSTPCTLNTSSASATEFHHQSYMGRKQRRNRTTFTVTQVTGTCPPCCATTCAHLRGGL